MAHSIPRPLSTFGRILVAILVIAAAVTPAAGAAEPTGDGVIATFEGTEINLAEGWGDARSCLIWQQGGIAECYRTEAEVAARAAELGIGTTEPALVDGGIVTASSSCSGYLKLYNGTNYTLSSLWLLDRFVWHNLVNYGFDQRTSSFKIGPCSAYFADWQNGGGDWYPTSHTQAYDQSPSMISGWNNDVSSVYIS